MCSFVLLFVCVVACLFACSRVCLFVCSHGCVLVRSCVCLFGCLLASYLLDCLCVPFLLLTRHIACLIVRLRACSVAICLLACAFVRSCVCRFVCLCV